MADRQQRANPAPWAAPGSVPPGQQTVARPPYGQEYEQYGAGYQQPYDASQWQGQYAQPTPAGAIIEARDVVKTYDTGKVKVPALRGVSFAVQRGEMVAVMGPSGSGKTTLLNCLAGLEAIDSGQIIVDGTDIATMSDKVKTDYRARNMGFIFQFYNLLPVLSAVENVELPLVVSGVNTKEARERAMHALDLVRLREWAGHKPAELSGGQRQRVTIARALVNQPAIVWADEPTGDLDSETADEVMSLMQQLNKAQGQTFIIVTHDAGIGARCGRLIKMRDGQITDDGLGHVADPRSFVGDGQARPVISNK
jgi:putative ABC transport system ATP-binding protein